MNIISNIFSRRNKLKYSYGYKNYRHDYYKQHNRIISNRIFSNLFLKANNFEFQYISSKDISPLNLTLGSYYYEVIRELGKPRFEINQGIGRNHFVLFYRKNIGDYKFLSQLHFYSNQLAYVKSDFDYLSHGIDCRTSILSSLFNKYSIKSDYDIRKDILIRDSENNIIKISDGGKISLEYYAGNEELVNSIINLNTKNISISKKADLEYTLIQSVV